MKIRRILISLATLLLVGSVWAFEPNNVECIAPADPGGGWDFTCRSVGKLLFDEGLVPQPVKVTNMPGAVGGVAYANVSNKRSDDANLLVATSTVGITQIAQGRYPSGVDTMRWLAMLGTDVGLILVRSDSPYQNLSDLLTAMVADPGKVVVGGSSGAGGWDHLRLLMLDKAAGMPGDSLKDVKWVQFDGGGPAVTQLLGKHIDVVSTDLGEIAGFVEAGQVRVLAVLSDDRLGDPFADLPTAKEQGFDVTGYNWRGFYTGGKVSDDAYNGWVDILHKLYDSDGWKQTAKDHGLSLIWRGGSDFDSYVRSQEDLMAEISREIGVIQ